MTCTEIYDKLKDQYPLKRQGRRQEYSIPPKEDLEYLYLELNLSMVEVQKIIGVGRPGFNRFLEYYGIKKSKEQISEQHKQTCLDRYGVPNASMSDKIKEKTKLNNIEKYGVSQPNKLQEIKDKQKQVFRDKYGVEAPMQSELVKENYKRNQQEKYGIDWSFQRKEVQDKINQTNLERFGEIRPLMNEEIKEKTKQSNLEKWGYISTAQSEIVKEKTRNTCMERYGVPYYMQSVIGNLKMEINYEQLEEEYLFCLSKMDVLQRCLLSDFPGNKKYPANHPIWDCNVAGKMTPKQAWASEEMLLKAVNNLFWITNKSIEEDKYPEFVDRIHKAFANNDERLLQEVLNRFTIAKIAPKVTALAPSSFLKFLDESGKDIENGLYCPMSGFGGIIEGAKRWYKKHKINPEGLIEAYDINPNLCSWYGWTQRDLLAQEIITDKTVFVCPPFGLKTERWAGTPLERDDDFKTNYLEFEDWCKLIKKYVKAPQYIFIGPETKNKKVSCGLFVKKLGIQLYEDGFWDYHDF